MTDPSDSRVDLHPTNSHDIDLDDEELFEDGPSLETREYRENPPVEAVRRRHRRSRILQTLNIGRMRHATPEERIAALRRLRSENEASDSTAEQGGRVGSSFSRRLSRVLGGSHGGSRRASGILNSRPVSEIPHLTAEPATHTTTTEVAPHAAETTAHAVETNTPVGETAHPHHTTTPPPTITEVPSHTEELPPAPAAETEFRAQAETAPHIPTETAHSDAAESDPPTTTAEIESPVTNER